MDKSLTDDKPSKEELPLPPRLSDIYKNEEDTCYKGLGAAVVALAMTVFMWALFYFLFLLIVRLCYG